MSATMLFNFNAKRGELNQRGLRVVLGIGWLREGGVFTRVCDL